MGGLAAAVISGVGHDRLLRSTDRTETIIEGMLVDLVSERREKLREQEIHMMANEIAKRFS
jgi:hypothetical protein